MIPKIINIDDVTKESIKEHNPNWPHIPDYPYTILMILKLFLNTRMIWMIFIKILKNTIRIKDVKY